jgi:cell division protein FtsI (penicillin-binding protein 3)
MSVREILMYSSNIGVTKIAESLGKRKLWSYLDAFGFGHRTGIDLPGEAEGRLRHWSRWARVSLATHSFGQGLSVTALQLAAAFSTLANGGFLIEPYMVQQVRDVRGRVIHQKQPKVVRRVVSKDTAERVLRVLEAVVEEGTGKMARVPGIRVAGKTGTSQKFDPEVGKYSMDRSVVSFAGILPADNPELVISVVLDEPRKGASGGALAAPAFREIASRCLAYCNLPGADPLIAAGSRPPLRFCSTGERGEENPAHRMPSRPGQDRDSWEMPSLRDLPVRTALRLLKGMPVEIRLKGSGRIYSQHPQAGSTVQAGQLLMLEAAMAEAG